MATQHGSINVTFVDDNGVRATEDLQISIDDTKTVANLFTDVAAIVATMAALSACGVARQETRLRVPLLGGVSATPTPDSDAEFNGEWAFANATTHYTDGVRIPGLLDALVVAAKIDRAGAGVGNFETAMTAAAVNATRIIGRDYYPFTAVHQTFLGVRKSRKQLHARSLDKR